MQYEFGSPGFLLLRQNSCEFPLKNLGLLDSRRCSPLPKHLPGSIRVGNIWENVLVRDSSYEQLKINIMNSSAATCDANSNRKNSLGLVCRRSPSCCEDGQRGHSFPVTLMWCIHSSSHVFCCVMDVAARYASGTRCHFDVDMKYLSISIWYGSVTSLKKYCLKKHVAITAFYEGFGKHNFTGRICYIVLCNMFLQYSMAVIRVCRTGEKIVRDNTHCHVNAFPETFLPARSTSTTCK